jgi:hypothetical protein
MKRLLIVAIVVVSVLAIVALQASSIVWGKGHVPTGKVQVCHKNSKVLEIDASSLEDHLGHSDFQLPACDFSNVFHKGEDCSDVSDENGDGFADTGLNPRDDAGGVTPACPPGTF